MVFKSLILLTFFAIITITSLLIINTTPTNNSGTMHCGWSMRSTMWQHWHIALRSGGTTTCRCSMVCANLWPLALTFTSRWEQWNNKNQCRDQFLWSLLDVIFWRAALQSNPLLEPFDLPNLIFIGGGLFIWVLYFTWYVVWLNCSVF